MRVLVVLLHVEQDLPTLRRERADGSQYQAARIFVLRDNRPIGEFILPFTADRLDPDEVRRGVADIVTEAPEPAVPLPPLAAYPLVSVVVATNLARRSMLLRCVRALARQDYPGEFEVIVVDNRRAGSPDDWADLAEPPRVRVVAEPRPGTSAARNRGVVEAASDIIAFTDDDTCPDRAWLRRLVERFAAEPDVDCVTGLVIPAELETPAQLWFEYSDNAFSQRYRQSSFGGGPYTVTNRLGGEPRQPAPVYAVGDFGTGSNMAFRRAAFARLGGFDEALGPGTPTHAGEEIQLFIRLLAAGGRLGFEPSAYIRHWHRRTVEELTRQIHGYGVGHTAMLAATVIDNPRHLVGMARLAGPVLRSVLRRRPAPARATLAVAQPSTLGAVRRRGMIVGPFAYVKSRRRIRR